MLHHNIILSTIIFSPASNSKEYSVTFHIHCVCNLGRRRYTLFLTFILLQMRSQDNSIVFTSSSYYFFFFIQEKIRYQHHFTCAIMMTIRKAKRNTVRAISMHQSLKQSYENVINLILFLEARTLQQFRFHIFFSLSCDCYRCS